MVKRILYSITSMLVLAFIWQADSYAQNKEKKVTSPRTTSSVSKPSSKKPSAPSTNTKKKISPTKNTVNKNTSPAKKVTTPAKKVTAPRTSNENRGQTDLGGKSKTTKLPQKGDGSKERPKSTGKIEDRPNTGTVSLDDALQQRKKVPAQGNAAAPPAIDENATISTTQTTDGGPSIEIDPDAIENSQDASGVEDGTYLGTPFEGVEFVQVGDDLYADRDGDGVADFVFHNAHVNEDGDVISGPPPYVFYSEQEPDEPSENNLDDENIGDLVADDDTVVMDTIDPDSSILFGTDFDGEYAKQVGDDVYVDSDGDGIVDEVIRDAHLADDGSIAAGSPPPPSEVDTADTNKPGRAKSGLLVGTEIAPRPDQQSQSTSANAAMIDTLKDIKDHYEQGLMPADQYDNRQLQALATLDPQQTGVEYGLQILRDLWDLQLITQTPYAAMREKYLDAL